MWFDSKDQPSSLEHIFSKQICIDPEAVYRAEHPTETTAPVIEPEPLQAEEGNISFWLIIVTTLVILIILILLVLLFRKKKDEKEKPKEEEPKKEEKFDPL